MKEKTMSRRAALASGTGALLAAAVRDRGVAGGSAEAGLSSKSKEIIRRYYRAWEEKNWHPFDILLSDNFTFTSAAGDDHIGKSAFKTKCWESQSDFIDRFDLQRVFGSGSEAFVLYVCRTKNGKTFRNVEYLQLRDDQVEAIECYFGAQSSFPSAVSKD